MVRARGMAAALFCTGGARRILYARRVVCIAGKAVVESTRLGVRPSLDGALRDDGRGSMVGVAARRIRGTATAAPLVHRPDYAQCGLDSVILWSASAGRGVRRNCAALVGDCRDASRLRPRKPPSRLVACAVSRLGGFCRGPEFYTLAIEHVKTAAEERGRNGDPAVSPRDAN